MENCDEYIIQNFPFSILQKKESHMALEQHKSEVASFVQDTREGIAHN